MDNCSPYSDSVETFETPVCLSNERALKAILQNISFLERKYGNISFLERKYGIKLPSSQVSQKATDRYIPRKRI